MICTGKWPTRRQEDDTGGARMGVHNGQEKAKKKRGARSRGRLKLRYQSIILQHLVSVDVRLMRFLQRGMVVINECGKGEVSYYTHVVGGGPSGTRKTKSNDIYENIVLISHTMPPQQGK